MLVLYHLQDEKGSHDYTVYKIHTAYKKLYLSEEHENLRAAAIGMYKRLNRGNHSTDTRLVFVA